MFRRWSLGRGRCLLDTAREALGGHGAAPLPGGGEGKLPATDFWGIWGKKRQHSETQRSCVREELSDPCWLLVGRAVGKGAGAARAPDPEVLLHRSTSKMLVLLTALLHTFFETSSKRLF